MAGNPDITERAIAIASLAFIAILVAYLSSRKIRRSIRIFLRSEVPGATATVIAFLLAVNPAYASGQYQGVFIFAAILCGVWFIVAFVRRGYQEEREKSLRFAHEALRKSQDLYNVIRDVKNLAYVLNQEWGILSLDQRIIEARYHAEQEYANHYRLDVLHFLQEMKRKDIWEDNEALALGMSMSYGTATVGQIEEMASMLNGISDDIWRYER